jgi:biotin carboxyl carrier protein
MRYFTKQQGQEQAIPVDIEPAGEGRYKLTLAGVTHMVDALTLDHGAVSMLVDGQSYSVEFDESGDDIVVTLRGLVTHIDVADDRKLRLRAGSATFDAKGRQTVVAPMPGKVTRVLVKVGDEVQQGQGLVVVEAMKMENELKSPKAGTVVELFAQEGSAVENNARLVVVE